MHNIKRILKEEIEEYKQWKYEGRDEDYCYDMIHEIFNQSSRGTLYNLMEELVKQ